MSALRPNLPAPPPQPAGEGEVALRFEDVLQDGRVRAESLPVLLQSLAWNRLLLKSPVWTELRADGILPILSRLVLVGADEPVAVAPVACVAHWQLARVDDEDGHLVRIVLNTWCEARGRRGRTFGPAPVGAGESVGVGRVFGEYTLTRPGADKADRAVRSLRLTGQPPVPETRYVADTPAALGALPRGVEALDAHPSTDPAHVVFGLDDTDSNRHVNSMAYLRIFRDGALRRLASHGVRGALALRWAEIAYRRPCFAGEAHEVELRAVRQGESVGVLAALGPEDPTARRNCHARLMFERA